MKMLKIFLVTLMTALSSLTASAQVSSFNNIFIKDVIRNESNGNMIIAGSFTDTVRLDTNVYYSPSKTSAIVVCLDSIGTVLEVKTIKSQNYASIKGVSNLANHSYFLSEAFNDIILDGDTLTFNQLGFLISKHDINTFSTNSKKLVKGKNLNMRFFGNVGTGIAAVIEFDQNLTFDTLTFESDRKGILYLYLDSNLGVESYSIREFNKDDMSLINVYAISDKLCSFYVKKLSNAIKIVMLSGEIPRDSVVLDSAIVEEIYSISYSFRNHCFTMFSISNGLTNGFAWNISRNGDINKKIMMSSSYLYVSRNPHLTDNLYVLKCGGSLNIGEKSIELDSSYNSLVLSIEEDTVEVLSTDFNIYGGIVNGNSFYSYYNYVYGYGSENNALSIPMNSKSGQFNNSKIVLLGSLKKHFQKSVNNNSNINSISIYPNPFNHSFLISNDNIQNLIIYDVAGKAVSFNSRSIGGKVAVNLSEPISGLLFVSYKFNGLYYNFKLLSY